jgi:predicted nucleic acid-binding protein
MTDKYVIDAHAWIEYLMATDAGAKIRTILEQNTIQAYTCAVTIAEVTSKTRRTNRNVEEVYNTMLSNSEVINADDQLSKQAGIIHAEMRKSMKDFPLADAYVLATARLLNAKIITGDPHFKNIKEATLITRK